MFEDNENLRQLEGVIKPAYPFTPVNYENHTF